MEKKELREVIRRRFLATTKEQRREWSEAICASLARDVRITGAGSVMAFCPMEDEPDILPFINLLRDGGKRVLMPEAARDGEIILRVYSGLNDVKKGLFGIGVPTGATADDYENIGAVLVPGIAFTKDGRRLGRGKGYYDRFLKRVQGAYKRGVCFPCQIVDGIPCEAHDIKVDYV